jgi:hypothetical protein
MEYTLQMRTWLRLVDNLGDIQVEFFLIKLYKTIREGGRSNFTQGDNFVIGSKKKVIAWEGLSLEVCCSCENPLYPPQDSIS